MKRKGLALISIGTFIMGMLIVVGGHAGTTMPVAAKIKAPYDHTETILEFTHQKHVVDYKIACGECHHDAEGKPLTNLKEGDNVQSCFECHNKPGEVKGSKAKKLSEKEKRAYHANAVHENCIGCHQKYNKEMKKKTAPQTCKDCHPTNK